MADSRSAGTGFLWHTEWVQYYFPPPKRDFLFASEWYKLFPENDPRHLLSWRGIFSDAPGTTRVNYWSDGEEVLGNIPIYLPDLPGAPTSLTKYSWGTQEKIKGLWPSSFMQAKWAGWGFNEEIEDWLRDPAVAKLIDRNPATTSLKTQPFFRKEPAALFLNDDGAAAAFANSNRFQLLASAIPARTFAMGANEVREGFDSYNMQANTNGWPDEERRPRKKGKWLHGDIKSVAYLYVHKVFENFVERGNLQ